MFRVVFALLEVVRVCGGDGGGVGGNSGDCGGGDGNQTQLQTNMKPPSVTATWERAHTHK